MPLKLEKPIGPDMNCRPFDISQLKKALNRLGYYVPLAEGFQNPLGKAGACQWNDYIG